LRAKDAPAKNQAGSAAIGKNSGSFADLKSASNCLNSIRPFCILLLHCKGRQPAKTAVKFKKEPAGTVFANNDFYIKIY
jgi:hypothetical protein